MHGSPNYKTVLSCSSACTFSNLNHRPASLDCAESVPDDQEFAELEAYVQDYENQVASSNYAHAPDDEFDWDDLTQNDLDAMDLS